MKLNTHKISIPAILDVGKGNLSTIGEILLKHNFTSVVIYFGNDLTKLFGNIIFTSLKENSIHIEAYDELNTININDVISMAFKVPSTVKAIIGIGGGKVIDVAKYCAFLRKLPFISVPTSSSCDGFSSSSASLMVNGKRTSVPAQLAFGIILDIDVIKSAPEKFIYSGIGDIVSKITALYDWSYEAKLGFCEIDDFAFMMAKKAVNSFIRTAYKTIKDDVFLRELVDSLTMSGIANEIAGNSSPSSGSEHLISHALDTLSSNPLLHGIQVGIATYIMSKVQNHHSERVKKLLIDTGFINYVKTLPLSKENFIKAIDIAPSIKPYRHTLIHEEKQRIIAKKIMSEDPLLTQLFD